MSKSNPTPVPASVVRAFFQSNVALAEQVAATASVKTNSVLGADGDASRIRGRINPAFVAAFADANPGQVYMETPKGGVTVRDTATVEIPRVGPSGRARKATTLTRTEALSLAGLSANRKGILSSAHKALVAEALTKAGR